MEKNSSKRNLEGLKMKYLVKLNGKSYEVEVEKVGGGQKVSPLPIETNAQKQETPIASPKGASVDGGHNVVTPMPGTVLDVRVSVGDAVKEGDVLFVLEAMKMENEIVSEVSGIIKGINVSKGSVLSNGDIMAVIA
jgi:glutaconyl-CoA/methylmalonyl-CoA decarboxylase subunit gamma